MNHDVLPCDPKALQCLLDQELSEAETQRMIAHLDCCEPCRNALESLAAGGEWWDQVAEFAGDRETTLSTAIEGELGFLAHSSKPGSLGRLGPYEVTSVLGRGGMGIVLLARDPALDRAVAIKVLAQAVQAGPHARQRFAREARAAAAVVHEHVVAIHAVENAGGIPYLVMQYIAGKSLQDRIDHDRPLRLEEILRIGMQVAHGLAAAHAQGLVHRDIKPANILLENGVERVKLTDFGLARAVDDSALTHSGVVAGTPQYMSPEQARGDPVDHRTDLFSLGSVLYAMASGRSPFRADSTPAVLKKICDEQPASLQKINADVPSWLVAIIDRLLAKDRAGRFQTAAEVAQILGRRLAGLQAPNPEGLETVPFLKPSRKRVLIRIAVGLCSIAGLVLIAIGTISVLRGSRSLTIPQAAVLPIGELAPNPIEPPRVAGPEQTISGVVQDRITGKGVAGVHLSLPRTPASAISDQHGRFSLTGQANAWRTGEQAAFPFEIFVEPRNLPYLACSLRRDVLAKQPVIELCTGIPFRVSLVDQENETPIRKAKVVYRPLHPNPFVEELLPRDAGDWSCLATESEDGVYTGVVLPGPGAIAVESYVDFYGPVCIDPVPFFDPGQQAGTIVNESTVYGTKGLLATESGGGRGVYYWPQNQMSRLMLINPEKGQKSLEIKSPMGSNRARSYVP